MTSKFAICLREISKLCYKHIQKTIITIIIIVIIIIIIIIVNITIIIIITLTITIPINTNPPFPSSCSTFSGRDCVIVNTLQMTTQTHFAHLQKPEKP